MEAGVTAPPVAIWALLASLAKGPPGMKGTLGDTQSLSYSFPPAPLLTGTPLPHPSEKLHCCQRCQPLQEDQQLGGTHGSGVLSPGEQLRPGRNCAVARAGAPTAQKAGADGPDRRARLARTRLRQAGRLGAPTPPRSDCFPT